MLINVDVDENLVPGGWVFGSDLRITDSVTASPLVLRAPAFAYPRSTLEFSLEEGVSRPLRRAGGRFERLVGAVRRRKTKVFDASRIVFDARYDHSCNVAHVLQGQIAPLLAGLSALGIDNRIDDVVVVVSEDTPDYGQALFKAFGIQTHLTEAGVAGLQLKMKPFKFPFRPYGIPFLRRQAVAMGLVADPTPKAGRIFLARLGRRIASNDAEVGDLLGKYGFERILAEDLPIEDQIAKIAGAEIVFAMHGAAMGFMKLRDPRSAGVVIETNSVGYTSNWARAISSRVGDTWFGLQGRWDAQHVVDLLRGAPPRRHEAASYELSIPMVEKTIQLAELAIAHGSPLEADRVLEQIPPVRL